MSHRILTIAAGVAVAATAPAFASAPSAPLRLAAAPAAGAKPAQQHPATRADIVKQAAASFQKVDTNHDGALTKAEIDAAQAQAQQRGAATIQQRMTQEFTKLDTDHNGQLTLAEFRAAAPSVRPADGSASATAMQRLDANKDGKISADEYRAPILATFDRIDTNHDGTLSADERAKAQAARAASKN